MMLLDGVRRNYDWGSFSAIPEYLGEEATDERVAELWYGAHASGPSEATARGANLFDLIADAPVRYLGEDVAARFDQRLPYLLKILAPAAPLSLQVHPTISQAREGYQRAQDGGPRAPIDYVDANHKPELLYVLTEFEALAGLRDAPTILSVLEGLEHPLIDAIREVLEADPVPQSVSRVLAHLLEECTPEDVTQIAAQCASKLAQGRSNFPHSDEIVGRLQQEYPADPGVVASLLLEARRLSPGEVMFVPAGALHAYLDGLGVELMANSDNVLRAGLTSKNVDVEELLKVVDPESRPVMLTPVAEGPGMLGFNPPVPDFELILVKAVGQAVEVGMRGPRIVFALQSGTVVTSTNAEVGQPQEQTLERGQAVFVTDEAGSVQIKTGTSLVATVGPMDQDRVSE